MNPSLQIFDDSILQFINEDFETEQLVDDCQFTEGPVWNDEGHYIFSDIQANTIYKLTPGGKKEVLVPNSGTNALLDEDLKPDQVGSNGLAWDKENKLLVCRHGSHMVAVWNGKVLQPMITNYNGKPFNSPNDIIVDEKGRVFFSDPPYGLKEGKPNTEKFQPIAGVYCYDNGDAKTICDKYQYPNGVCITPNKKQLYICSNKPFEAFISVYDLETLQFQKILAEETSDGIKCDPHGNVYLSNKDGLLILNSEGKRQALLKFSTQPANHCFGGTEKKDLFITARQNVFLVKNLLK